MFRPSSDPWNRTLLKSSAKASMQRFNFTRPLQLSSQQPRNSYRHVQFLCSTHRKPEIGPDLEIVKTQGCQWVRDSPSPKGGRADLRLDVALPTSGEGLRAELGELFGVGRNMVTTNNNIRITNFDSYSTYYWLAKRCIP